ncbi:MAG: flagellar basal body rod protein FlgB [Syntrophomonadaceae bacterium]|jgi:flagellar basal-body rod protein FlgB|nr:flagellar basal body rod protein FlgB [Syntrophomonadaceae bacterium]
MIDEIFSNQVNTILKLGMDAASMRNEVIADNIANAETPGFKKSEVDFEQRLQGIINKNYSDKTSLLLNITNTRHMQINDGNQLAMFQPRIRAVDGTSSRNDGNNVDIDVEMANNTKNNTFYEAVNRSMTNEIKILRLAITGKE